MVRKIEQFQKLNNVFSDRLSPYERQEIFALLPLWQECLNVCQVQLYAKFREEDLSEARSWKEHPYKSFACFVKDHKKIEYRLFLLDVEDGYQPDEIINLKLMPAGEYRIEQLLGKDVIVFASNLYYLGIVPIDSVAENKHLISNVKNAIGNWWHITNPLNWKDINNAVKKLKAKAENKAVATVRPEQVLMLVGQHEPKGDVEPAVIIPVFASKDDVDKTILIPVGAHMEVKQGIIDTIRSVTYHDVKEPKHDSILANKDSVYEDLSNEEFEDLMHQTVEDTKLTSYALKTEVLHPHPAGVVYVPEPAKEVEQTRTSVYERLLHPTRMLPEEPPLIVLEPISGSEAGMGALTPSGSDMSRAWSIDTVPSKVAPVYSLDYEKPHR